MNCTADLVKGSHAVHRVSFIATTLYIHIALAVGYMRGWLHSTYIKLHKLTTCECSYIFLFQFTAESLLKVFCFIQIQSRIIISFL